jgi:2-oxoisovalerate dehydrogenase E1 component alpha subunit
MAASSSAEAVATGKAPAVQRSKSRLKVDPETMVKGWELMAKARLLEERLIQMYKQSDGFFWIGAPGEEAFQIALGMQCLIGEGKDYDYFHLHYRGSPLLLCMGMDPADAMRQMKNSASDPFSGGRNFGNHFAVKKWNVAAVTSTIGTQYATAIGSGIAQRRHGGKGVTIVTGGDAGTAEGEFASSLIWSSRPGFELPMFLVVTNNQWGISTSAEGQHGETKIADRGTAFNIKSKRINGLDFEEAYLEVKEALEYCREERKPFLMEAMVTRLYGHSSATGANRVEGEADPLEALEKRLLSLGLRTEKEIKEYKENVFEEFKKTAIAVRDEPQPTGDTIYDYTYCGQKGRYF